MKRLVGALAPLVALALAVVPIARSEPEGVHLGMPEKDGAASRSVLWLDASPAPASVTLEGPDGAVEIASEMVPGPSAGFAFEAKLPALEAGASYRYSVGGRAFELATSARDALSIVALGDMGVRAESRAALSAIDALAPDLVLHAGDVSYAEGNALAWREWFAMVEPVASRVPWMIAIGNHETYTASVEGPVEPAFFRQRFGFPGNELWYAFDWPLANGSVHVVALDTFTQGGIPQAEIDWLAEDLAGAAGATWTIALLHEPPYSSNAAHGGSARVEDAFVPLFDAHGVDLVITAHDHSYERTRPMRGGAIADGGTVYVVTGGGGQSLYEEFEEPAPAWSAARAAVYHVTHLVVTDRAIEGRIVTTMGDAFADSFVISRSAPLDDSAGSTPRGLPIAGAWAVLSLLAAALGRRRR